MKKLLTILMCASFLFACSSDKDNVEPEGNQYQQVLTRIKTLDGTFPQPGVYVYIFMDGDYSTNDYKYNVGGTFTSKDGKEVRFTYQDITSKEGKSAIKANFGNRPYTVVVQRYKDSTSGAQMFYVPKFDNKYVIDILYDYTK